MREKWFDRTSDVRIIVRTTFLGVAGRIFSSGGRRVPKNGASHPGKSRPKETPFQGTLVSSRGTGLVRTAMYTPEKGMTKVRFAPFPSCVGAALAGFPMGIHACAFVHLHSSPPYPARRALTCQNRAMSPGGERGRRHARLFPRRSPPHADFCSCR